MRELSVKPRDMTPQSGVNLPKIHLKTAQNGEKHYKKRVMRANFALISHLQVHRVVKHRNVDPEQIDHHG